MPIHLLVIFLLLLCHFPSSSLYFMFQSSLVFHLQIHQKSSTTSTPTSQIQYTFNLRNEQIYFKFNAIAHYLLLHHLFTIYMCCLPCSHFVNISFCLIFLHHSQWFLRYAVEVNQTFSKSVRFVRFIYIFLVAFCLFFALVCACVACFDWPELVY